MAEGLAHTGGAWHVARENPRSRPGLSGLGLLPQRHGFLEGCSGLVSSPGVGRAGFRSWGCRDFPDPHDPSQARYGGTCVPACPCRATCPPSATPRMDTC